MLPVSCTLILWCTKYWPCLCCHSLCAVQSWSGLSSIHAIIVILFLLHKINVLCYHYCLFIIVDEARAVRAFTRTFVLTAAGNG